VGGDVVELRQRPDVNGVAVRGDVPETGDGLEIDHDGGPHDTEPHPVDQFGTAGQQHRPGCAGAVDGLVDRGGPLVGERDHDRISVAAWATAAAICG
jgi:hypothetical protein